MKNKTLYGTRCVLGNEKRYGKTPYKYIVNARFEVSKKFLCVFIRVAKVLVPYKSSVTVAVFFPWRIREFQNKQS